MTQVREEAYRRYQAGDRAGAERLCRRVLQAEPGHAEAVYLLAVLAQDAARREPALALFREAARLAPANAVFVNALGEALLAEGKTAEALACFQNAVRYRPTYERAHNNLGRVHMAEGNPAAAEASFAEAVKLNSNYATGHNNRGAALQALGRLDEAAACYRQALQQRPDYTEAHFNWGTVLQAQGDAVAAAARFAEALRLRPDYGRAHFHLGQVLEQQRREPEALACFQAAARLLPGDVEVARRLGDLLGLRGDWAGALSAHERAVALRPDDPKSFARLCYTRLLVCDWGTYQADLERLWADCERALAAGEATAVVPFQALTLPWPLPRLLAVARSHCRAIAAHQRERGPRPEFSHPKACPDRLRVGYLSGDFYDHPVAHLLQGLFGRHDRTLFEVFAYSFGPPDNSVYRRRIEAGCEHFVDVAALSVADLARRIAADDVHILVDLMGHTGINRLGALALRPAPIQVSFLGMLGTSGADFLDYLIADPTVVRPEYAGSFTEQFVTLPDSYLIAEPDPPPADPVRRGDHGLPEVGFVFCSFSSTYKIEPATFAAWMRMLARVPGSVLWLYSTGPVVEANLRREAKAQGVDPGRLVFAPFVPRPGHLARHRAADLFLDPWVYNGAATTALALQAGVPVLACPGQTFASRVGASLLTTTGLPELIAADLADYEEKAVHLAQHPDELAALRAKVEAARGCPLFDTPRFTRHLEQAYLALWDLYESGQAPRPIRVGGA